MYDEDYYTDTAELDFLIALYGLGWGILSIMIMFFSMWLMFSLWVGIISAGVLLLIYFIYILIVAGVEYERNRIRSSRNSRKNKHSWMER